MMLPFGLNLKMLKLLNFFQNVKWPFIFVTKLFVIQSFNY